MSRTSSGFRDFLSVAVFGLAMLMARSSLADHYTVPTGSMQPTVDIGDRIVVDKSAYGWRLPWSDVWLTEVQTPSRGDVVVLRSPEDDRVLLKRVVAVGGDSVTVRRGVVSIDGRAVEPTKHGGWGGPDFGPTTVPDDTVLVLGDNRGNSRDGRSFGFVRQDDLLGRAVAIYWHHGEPTWLSLR